MYKLLKNSFGDTTAVLKDNKWQIPFDPDNTDYQAYLKWLEEGNTPLPAEDNNG